VLVSHETTPETSETSPRAYTRWIEHVALGACFQGPPPRWCCQISAASRCAYNTRNTHMTHIPFKPYTTRNTHMTHIPFKPYTTRNTHMTHIPFTPYTTRNTHMTHIPFKPYTIRNTHMTHIPFTSHDMQVCAACRSYNTHTSRATHTSHATHT